MERLERWAILRARESAVVTTLRCCCRQSCIGIRREVPYRGATAVGVIVVAVVQKGDAQRRVVVFGSYKD